ncbi:C10 family peptidase [Tenacibaculum dicentrarchi]|nr:C10 family peptidase [Tenacibaculum dicentrarchi]MCD8424002.1 C10 family peptidase [Tenacibaculum dicentrarchi]MCD8441307.1 C10 family peptidase [Tenacibaculum dicentrarchi]MDB0614588.1 C10 family peptidase [Tenacibaculum dicentrarchi]
MKRLKKTKQLILIFLLGILIYSCSENEQFDTKVENIKVKLTKNFVNLDEVSSIASAIEYPLSLNSKNASLRAKGVTSISKKIKNITKVPDENGNTTYYIINHKDSGFIILSADNRTNPVLAYSEDSNFTLNPKELTSGLVQWLSDTKDYVKNIRLENKKQTKQQAYKWNPNQLQKAISRRPLPPDEDGCKNTYKTVGPLLKTNWHQRSGFNNYMPEKINCDNLPNNRAYAGCVPIAMAQVMKYHEYPKKYNWNAMPNNNGSNTTSLFIKDIHHKIKNMYGGGTNPLSYKCDGTGVSSGANIAIVLTRDFGFSSATKADYNYDTVVNELNYNRPVILSGSYKSGGWWVFSSYSGHMWVCDGYRRSMIYSEDCTNGWSYLFLHMNWGWGQHSVNGWFAFNNWNPNNSTYNKKRKMIYNIKP